MDTLVTTVGFLFLVMETIIGTVANGSIVLINFIDWFRTGKLSPTDLILISLGLSRLLLQAVVILSATLFILFNDTVRNILLTVTGIWTFANTVNLWFGACLSVFYLAKIAIFSHPVFLQVKQRLSGLVPWLLLGSVVVSAVITVIIITTWSHVLPTCNPYGSLLSNRSYAEMAMPPVCIYVTTVAAVFDFIPFMVFLSSSLFLISSLWKHMRRMQHNGTGSRDLNTQAHLSAIKALASFAVLYLISFAAVDSQLVLVQTKQLHWVYLLFSISAVYPSGHAVVLILINPKLKQAWIRKMHHFKGYLNKGPS